MVTKFYISDDGEVLGNREHPVVCPDFVLPLPHTLSLEDDISKSISSLQADTNYTKHFKRFKAVQIEYPNP